jgi:hypothetical protein
MLVLETNKEIKRGERELLKIKFYNANELIILHNYVLHEWFQDFIFYIMDFGKFVNPLH